MNPVDLPWRTGRKQGRTLYADDGVNTDPELAFGMVDSPEIAEHIVELHNAALRQATTMTAREQAQLLRRADEQAADRVRPQVVRCEITARHRVGTGVCDAPLGPYGECPNAGMHIVED